MEVYQDIKRFLEENKDEKSLIQWMKTIKTHKNIIGVKLEKINHKINEWSKRADYEDIMELWEDGKTEERIIAAKILGKIGKRDIEQTCKLIKDFSLDLEDWATTDTLATQGIKGIIKYKENEIKLIAKQCLYNENIWTRRFGVVVFINFPGSKEAKEVIEELKGENNYYVKKALEWLKRKIESSKNNVNNSNN